MLERSLEGVTNLFRANGHFLLFLYGRRSDGCCLEGLLRCIHAVVYDIVHCSLALLSLSADRNGSTTIAAKGLMQGN